MRSKTMKIFRSIKESFLSLSQAVSSLVEKVFKAYPDKTRDEILNEILKFEKPEPIHFQEKDKPQSMVEFIEQKKNNQPFYKDNNKKPWE